MTGTAILMQAASPTYTPSVPARQVNSSGWEFFLLVGIGLGVVLAGARNGKPEAKDKFLEEKQDNALAKPTEGIVSGRDSLSASNQIFATSSSEAVSPAYSFTPPSFLEEMEQADQAQEKEPDKYSWVDRVIKLPFRILSGSQGSGKSTLERFMISRLKQDGWHVVCINLETNPDLWQGVEVIAIAHDASLFFADFPEWVRERQEEARAKGIDEDNYYDLVKARSGREGLIAIFLMETNTYEVHGVNPEHWANFLKQSLTNIRKWGFTTCFTAHSDNQGSISSQLKNFSKLLDSQPRIECIAVPDPKTGEAVSSGEAWLRMEGVRDKNPLKIPLKNFPKTKDFRTRKEREEQIELTRVVRTASKPEPKEELEEYQKPEFLDMVYSACKGKGRIKISRLPTESKPVRNLLIKKFGKQDFDDIKQVEFLHVILGILEYQGKIRIYCDRNKHGAIVPSKDSEFEVTG